MGKTTPEDVPAALIAAAEELCAEQDPRTVQMREIARRAGVSTGLSYHYFESKAALLGATLDAIASAIDEAAATKEEPEDMASQVLEVIWDRPAFPRIMASLVLAGTDITEAMSDHPFLRRLIDVGSGGTTDGTTRAGLIIVTLLGAGLYGRAVNRAIGRPLDDNMILTAHQEAVQDLLGRSGPQPTGPNKHTEPRDT
jgi:AcrR family transcriptional regulator